MKCGIPVEFWGKIVLGKKAFVSGTKAFFYEGAGKAFYDIWQIYDGNYDGLIIQRIKKRNDELVIIHYSFSITSALIKEERILESHAGVNSAITTNEILVNWQRKTLIINR